MGCPLQGSAAFTLMSSTEFEPAHAIGVRFVGCVFDLPPPSLSRRA